MVQEKPEKEMKCPNKGTIKDMTGLDGCTYFIVTEEGRELAPVNWQAYDVNLTDGMIVSFDVDLLRDQTSICMAEDAMVRLKCFEILEQ